MGEVAVLYLRLCHKLYTGRDKGKDSGKDEEFLNREDAQGAMAIR
jgi:hypothetical protein